MTAETLFLFAALAAFTTLGIWINRQAADLLFLVVSLVLVLAGVAGMVFVVGAALLGTVR